MTKINNALLKGVSTETTLMYYTCEIQSKECMVSYKLLLITGEEEEELKGISLKSDWLL